MTVKDLVMECDLEKTLKCLKKNFDVESTDDYKTLFNNRKNKKLTPIPTADEMYIYVELNFLDDELEFHVFGRYTNGNGDNCNVSALNHNYFLNFKIDEMNLASFDKEIFLACVLWESAWFGMQDDKTEIIREGLRLSGIVEID